MMLYLPRDKVRKSLKPITLLLPYYLHEGFISIFNAMGFAVIHSPQAEALEREIKKFPIDLAIEWQHGPKDYPIRNLLKKHKKSTPILLSLNWNGTVPPNFRGLGYQDYLNVPWKIKELKSKLHKALPKNQKQKLGHATP
jgi:DNA-binding response OmpR family regulator